jgi:acyl-CoA reductase-like NAD-dependent aldehyde dehydrogenase
MEMNWSRWFYCESSFGLLLVPNQPGIFALAEEVIQPAGPHSRRMLAVFEVEEADDLARAMSRLFAAGSPWREKLAQARCYVRYAIAPSIADRRAAAAALKNWLGAQREVASQIFEKSVSVPSELELAMAPAQILARPESLDDVSGEELKTIAERAVDRVTHGIRLSKAFPAEF